MASFEFQYHGMIDRDAGCGEWADNQIAIWGKLQVGELSLGDEICLPAKEGSRCFVGKVARFSDSFYEWLGMPFYDRITPHSVAHCCVCIGFPSPVDLQLVGCPGTAIHPMQAEVDPNGLVGTRLKEP